MLDNYFNFQLKHLITVNFIFKFQGEHFAKFFTEI